MHAVVCAWHHSTSDVAMTLASLEQVPVNAHVLEAEQFQLSRQRKNMGRLLSRRALIIGFQSCLMSWNAAAQRQTSDALRALMRDLTSSLLMVCAPRMRAGHQTHPGRSQSPRCIPRLLPGTQILGNWLQGSRDSMKFLEHASASFKVCSKRMCADGRRKFRRT